MNIPSNPSSSLSFPFGDPSTVQAGLAAAGTAVTAAGSTATGILTTIGATVTSVIGSPVVVTGALVVGCALGGYKIYKCLTK